MKNHLLIIILFLSSCFTVSAQSIVAYYRFNNNVDDSVNVDNNGTGSDISTFFDRFGNPEEVYRINGSNTSKIIIPIQNFQLNSYTYSVWTKIASLPAPGSASTIICNGEAATANQSILLMNVGGTYRWTAISYYDNISADNIIYSSMVDTSKWYHIVLTRDSAANSMHLYIDGSWVNGNDSLTNNVAAYGDIANANFLLGLRGNVQGLDGWVDDLRIYDYALDSNEVSNLFDYEKTGSTGLWESTLTNEHITIYPNPSSGAFDIRLTNHSPNNIVAIYNMQGQVVYKASIINENISVNNLGKGIYFATIQSEEGVSKAVKIVIN